MLLTRAVAPEEHLWLRVCQASWSDPLDTSYARVTGGRWNPPDSWDALYVSRDLPTARMQVEELADGWFYSVSDLRGDAYELIGVILPRGMTAVDVVSDEGVQLAGFLTTFPFDVNGDVVSHEKCWPVAQAGYDQELDGVEARSARSRDGSGQEFCWWTRGRPVTARTARVPLDKWVDDAVTDVRGVLGAVTAETPDPSTEE